VFEPATLRRLFRRVRTSDARISSVLAAASLASGLHSGSGVSEHPVPDPDRRARARSDRRKNSRSGRRARDPRTNWRRIAWLFAAYAAYLSVRSLPEAVKSLLSTVRKWFGREPVAPA